MAAFARSRVAVSGLAAAGAASISQERDARNAAECRAEPRQVVSGQEVEEAAKMIFMPTSSQGNGEKGFRRSSQAASCREETREDQPDLGPHGRFAHDMALGIALDPYVQRAIFDRLPLGSNGGPFQLDSLDFGQRGGGGGQETPFEKTSGDHGASEQSPPASSSASSLSSDTQRRGDLTGVGASLVDDEQAGAGTDDRDDDGFDLFDDDFAVFDDDDDCNADEEDFKRMCGSGGGGGDEATFLVLRELKREVALLREELDEQRTLNEQLVYQNSDLQDQLKTSTQKAGAVDGNAAESTGSGDDGGGDDDGGAGESGGQGLFGHHSSFPVRNPSTRRRGGHGDRSADNSNNSGSSSSGDDKQRRRQVQRDVAWAVRGAVAVSVAMEGQEEGGGGEGEEATDSGMRESAGRESDPTTTTADGGQEIDTAAVASPFRQRQRRQTRQRRHGERGQSVPTDAGEEAKEGEEEQRGHGASFSANDESSKNGRAHAEAVIRGAVVTLATSVVLLALLRRCQNRFSAPSSSSSTAAASSKAQIATVAAIKFHESALASSAYSAFASAMRTAASFA